MSSAVATFCVATLVLLSMHGPADQWVQTHSQAVNKGRPGWPGRLACAAHVATYTATGLVALLVVAAGLGLHLNPWRLAAGCAVTAVTHYWADRRTTLIWLANATGHGGYLAYGTVMRTPNGEPQTAGPGTALFHLDQSWHGFWIPVAALIIAS